MSGPPAGRDDPGPGPPSRQLAGSDETGPSSRPLTGRHEPGPPSRPLEGRGALVTGVSRRVGIGYAVAARLQALGAAVVVQGFDPPAGGDTLPADAGGVAGLAAELGAKAHVDAGFSDPAAPAACVAAAAAAVGHLDILIANHAASCNQSLEQLAAGAIDLTLAVNVRASLLLVQAFAAQHDDARPGGRVILLTSGQNHEPMPRELPYAASKGALTAVTPSLAAHLAPRGILVNAVNPGPTDTGWATPELTRHELRRLPLGRWGAPEDAARAIAWLATDEAAWMTGQVLTSDGGFSLSRG